MTVASVVTQQNITATWGNSVAVDVNAATANIATSVRGGAAIIELATTPTGITHELRWSTVHNAMMRWNGTQWVFAEGPPSYLQGWDAFDPYGSSGGGFLRVVSINGGTTGGLPASNILQRHPGAFIITSSTSTNSGGRFINGTNIIGGASTGVRMREIFRIPAAGLIATTTHYIGMHDSVNQSDATNGIYLAIVNATATFKTADNGSRTSNATTATLVADTWYTVHIWFVTSTTARCIIVKDDGTVVLDVTNVANVPTSARAIGLCHVSTNSATSAVDLATVDYMGVGYSE